MPRLGSLSSRSLTNVGIRGLFPSLYAFTSQTFTSAGTVGRYGPTLAALQSAYSASTWTANTAFFTQGRAQGYQVWTVPQTGTYIIEAAGARGQNSASIAGNYGRGARVRAQVFLTAGDKLEMVVGQVPGNGGSTQPGNSYAGAGGGSFVAINGTSTPIIVAGGGGGSYSTYSAQAIVDGQTRRQPRWDGYNFSPASLGTHPQIGYGGPGYHGGGGGGFLGHGTAYPGRAISDSAMATDSSGQQYTSGAGFIGTSSGSTLDPVPGTWYALGGNATALTSEGGFGGGGGGHSGNNTGGAGGGYSGGLGGQTSLGGSVNTGTGGGSYIIPSATAVATSNGQYDDSGTFNGTAITNIGAFNDGNGYITITAVAPSSGSYLFSTGFSTYTPITDSPGIWARVATSNTIGLSTTATAETVNGQTYYAVNDSAGNKWYILANWSFGGTPGRWGNNVVRNLGNIDGVNIISRVNQQSATSALATQVTPGVMYVDAVSFSNQSGQGFANWYTDSKSNQAYPALNTAITNAVNVGGVAGALFEFSSGLDNTGGAVWFEPPLGTREVMMDFANSHSNGPCTVAVVEKSTGTVKYVVCYGQFGTVNTGSGAINDPAARTLIFRHIPGYVYFNTDHGGTIAGSHYYLFR